MRTQFADARFFSTTAVATEEERDDAEWDTAFASARREKVDSLVARVRAARAEGLVEPLRVSDL